ncbi:MAG: hypothetical protein RLZZ387_3147 [Chloroflexota bacterium]|jgi:Zn-dependent metalloprotease
MPRRNMLAALTLAILLLTTLTPATAAQSPADTPYAPEPALLTRLKSAAGGQADVYRHAETGAVRFLDLQAQPVAVTSSLVAQTPEQASRAFLARYGQLFGLRDQARELVVKRQTAAHGRSLTRFQQVYQGVPVLGGELIVQTDARRAVVSAGGELLPRLSLAIQPRIQPASAVQEALAVTASVHGADVSNLQSTQPELWIYDPALLGGPGLRVTRLVWRVEITPRASGLPIRELVLIDAQVGAVALHFNQIADARSRVVCNDNNVPDADGDAANNCVPARYVRVEGQPATGVADVDMAYDYAGDTYDYFFNNFGRDSLDGRGMTLVSLVKYCPDASGCPYENAFWNGQQMTYGDGFASADDVVGHELAHGLTEFTSNLLYYYQSGAINESLSDVFGELIDQANGDGTDTPAVRWLMGEDLSSLGVIRNMADPTSLPAGVNGPYFSPAPDRMTSSHYWGAIGDNGGVHTNSGVNNKAAFLMTDGGTFNGQTVAGLGALKTGAIYYTLQTSFLTSASDYQDLSTGLPAACDLLASAGSYGVTAGNCGEVRKVVTATEMGQAPPAAPTVDAPICAVGLYPADVFADDFEDSSNGMWASSAAAGESTWYYPMSANPFGWSASYATSGTGNLWGYAPSGEKDTAIAMTENVTVPADAFLHFRHAFDFQGSDPNFYDGGVVEYSTNAGATWSDAGALFTHGGYNATLFTGRDNPLSTRQAFGSVSNGYGASRLDLSTLAGEQVRFRFRIGSDEPTMPEYDWFYGWFIDDLRVYTCGNTPPSSPATPLIAPLYGDWGRPGSTFIFGVQGFQSDEEVAITVGGARVLLATVGTDGRLTFIVTFDTFAAERTYTIGITPVSGQQLATTHSTEITVTIDATAPLLSPPVDPALPRVALAPPHAAYLPLAGR